MRLVLRGSRLTVVAAAVAMLAVLPMSALPLLHDVGNDDACTPQPSVHDAAAHYIGAAAAPSGGSPHCAICHCWQSQGRFRGSHLSSALIPFVDIGRVVVACFAEPGLVATAIGPARAPPNT
jgi:hypothetical protein